MKSDTSGVVKALCHVVIRSGHSNEMDKMEATNSDMDPTQKNGIWTNRNSESRDSWDLDDRLVMVVLVVCWKIIHLVGIFFSNWNFHLQRISPVFLICQGGFPATLNDTGLWVPGHPPLSLAWWACWSPSAPSRERGAGGEGERWETHQWTSGDVSIS